VSVRAPDGVTSVTRAPGGEAVAHEQRDGRVEITMPRLDGHALLVLAWR
jgi:hypothetical protein